MSGQLRAGPIWLRSSTCSRGVWCGKPDALLHHSDRGSQYTSEQFQRLLADHGVICSMSRSGNVWDNAAMESFFSSLKIERTARKIYRTREEAKEPARTLFWRLACPSVSQSQMSVLTEKLLPAPCPR